MEEQSSVIHPSYCADDRFHFRMECIQLWQNLPPPSRELVAGGPSRQCQRFLRRLYPLPQTLMDAYDKVMMCVKEPGLCSWLDTVKGCIAWRVWRTMGIHVLSEQMVQRMEETTKFSKYMVTALGVEWMHILYSSTQRGYFFQEPERCSICLENIYHPVETRCGHPFHDACLQRSYFMSSCCPYCRQEL